MHDLQSLTLIIDIAIIITASFLIGFIAHKFKQSIVLAYIFAGVLIGPYGFQLIKNLKEKGDILIIEHDPRKIDEIKKIGCSYIYGDAVSPEILKMANVDEASILILALPDMKTKQIAIRFAKECNPNVFIISRAFDIVESKEWEKIGADRTTVPHLIEAAAMLRMIQEKLSLKS